MSLADWHTRNRWIKPHQTSAGQIADLLEVVDRDLADARTARLSVDWQFGIAYNAALKLCTILLYASGYRAENQSAHQRTIQALALIMPERKADAAYLDTCRAKRNQAEYDIAGQISASEARELIDFTDEFRIAVVDWLKKHHPSLAP